MKNHICELIVILLFWLALSFVIQYLPASWHDDFGDGLVAGILGLGALNLLLTLMGFRK